MKKKILGIGGFIGSGKTTAGMFFAEQGAHFIDADDIVSGLYEPGKGGYLKIVNYFGSKYLDKSGQINRVKLGKFIFSDSNKLKIINNLIHPLVTNEVQKIVDKSKKDFIVIEAAYFEAKHVGKFVDAILWIECAKKNLLERAQRYGMEEKMLDIIIKVQEKPKKIDYKVANNGSEQDFELALQEVWEDFTSAAS